MPSLREVVDVLDSLYHPRWADEWDAVGTVAGDPAAEIRSVLFAVDPVRSVVEDAIARGVDLLVTHHPLWLNGVTSVSAGDPKGRVVHDLIRHGIALHTCHTNADSPPLGVSEAMAMCLDLREVRPLRADSEPGLDAWVVHVPLAASGLVAEAMHEAGAGRIGDYDRAVFGAPGVGSFRPLQGANPVIGQVGQVEHVDEARLDLVAERGLREQIRAALISSHPYEEPSYQVIELADGQSQRGSGRIGVLPYVATLGEFAEHVTASLPGHRSATRVAGHLDRPVRTVAVCGGSGDFLLPDAQAAGADVFVTSDLKHHRVSEHLEHLGACAVIDVPHWAAEWTWLPVAAAELERRLGGSVSTHVSRIVTDPWTAVVRPDPRSLP